MGNVVKLHNGVSFSGKKNEVIKFPGKLMELETITPSEVTQAQ